jgi:hypothetical protein
VCVTGFVISLVGHGEGGSCASLAVKHFLEWQYCIKATIATVEKMDRDDGCINLILKQIF